MPKSKSNVLIIAGHDPSGGAGVHADIEAVTSLGGHASSVITCLTLQNTHNAQQVWPIETDKLIQQLNLLADDIHFDAIKLGLLGTPEIASAVSEFIVKRLAGIPLVVDPVLVASGGGELAVEDIINSYKQKLFPLASVVTPNAHERHSLTVSSELDEQISEFLASGMQSVLLKGGDEQTQDVVNTLYLSDGLEHELKWSRFEGEFHGSGCTLASAIAAELAKGDTIVDAVATAQSYTWSAIKHAYRPGSGQSIPNRQFKFS